MYLLSLFGKKQTFFFFGRKGRRAVHKSDRPSTKQESRDAQHMLKYQFVTSIMIYGLFPFRLAISLPLTKCQSWMKDKDGRKLAQSWNDFSDSEDTSAVAKLTLMHFGFQN